MATPQPDPSADRPRWALSREALDGLLDALDPDREAASRRYETLRRKLINLFAWERSETPEDLADEAINRLARRLSEGVTLDGGVDRYAYGIARLLLREEGRARQKRDAALQEMVVLRGGIDRSDTLQRLRRCVNALPADSRTLIQRYYAADRSALARSLGISINALRNRALRLREQLHDCVQRTRDI